MLENRGKLYTSLRYLNYTVKTFRGVYPLIFLEQILPSSNPFPYPLSLSPLAAFLLPFPFLQIKLKNLGIVVSTPAPKIEFGAF